MLVRNMEVSYQNKQLKEESGCLLILRRRGNGRRWIREPYFHNKQSVQTTNTSESQRGLSGSMPRQSAYAGILSGKLGLHTP